MVMDTDQSPHWMNGDVIVFRGVSRRIIWWALPVIVVQDTPDLIAFYWRAGTPNKIPPRRVSPREVLELDSVNLIDEDWSRTDVLQLVLPGAQHAVYAMWETGCSHFRGWYINLQAPLRRMALGFDTMDYLLDIVVSADKSTWRWKDEDEFEEAIAVGLFNPEQARAIRAEGEKVIRSLHQEGSLFNCGWEKWSAPGEWRIPAFPAGWDEV
jgi:hypothetical protein